MAKTIFEFNEDEEYDVELTVNRHKLAYALHELADFRRDIYKGYIDNQETVFTDTKQIFTEEDFEEKNGYIPESKTYIHDEYVLRRLDDILDMVYQIIND